MNLEEFIRTQLESVDELRILLLFQSRPQTEWDAIEMAGKLYLQPALAAAILTRLAARGFLIARGEPLRYCFQPQSVELRQLIEQLAKMDRERPVTLIQMIYRSKDIQAFADAFKFKKEKEN